MNRSLPVVFAAAAVVITGCGQQKPSAKPPVQPPETAMSASSGSPTTAPADAVQVSPSRPVDGAVQQPDFLAQQAEQYVKSMSQALPPDSTPQTQLPKPSQVDWRLPGSDAPAEAAMAATSDASPVPPVQQPTRTEVASGVVLTANEPVSVADARKADLSTIDLSNSVGKVAPTELLAEKLFRRARDYPRDVSAQLDYQLYLFLKDEPVPQLTSLAGLPGEDRELITTILDGLSNFRSTLRSDNNMLLSRKIAPLTDMSDRLGVQADLHIPTLTLCKKVDAFGRYEPIEPARFPAGRTSDAIVYCEIDNLSSQFNAEKKQWQTDLTQEVVLYTESGMQVWADKPAQLHDYCRTRRDDFFVSKLITLPGNLSIGSYLLKVTIVDQQNNRVAESSLPVQIVAQ